MFLNGYVTIDIQKVNVIYVVEKPKFYSPSIRESLEREIRDIPGLHFCMLNGDEYKFQMGLELFGLNYNKVNIEKSKQVILLESPKSVMQADSFNMPNICVGMFGMNFSIQKLKLLLNLGVENFVIALDRQYDVMRGQEWEKYKIKVNRIVDIIRPYAKEISIIYDNDIDRLLDYKDSPTDKGEEIFDLIEKGDEYLKSYDLSCLKG